MSQVLWRSQPGSQLERPRSATRGLWRSALSAVEWGLTVVAFLALLATLSVLVLLRHAPDGETSVLGRPLLAVATGSMSPTFNPGDLILDTPVSGRAADRLQRGEVITFRSSAYSIAGRPILITHRIYAVVTNPATGGVAYRTKGDANNTPDPGLVAPAAVVGIYRGWRIPYGAYVLNYLHGPVPFVTLVVLLVALLGAGEFRRRWRALGAPASPVPPGSGSGGLW